MITQPIRSIIVDDEPGNIVTLSELLKAYCPHVEVVATAPDPIKAHEAIQKYQPQLVFLDIEMPYGNAFDLLDKCNPINFEVIFITAFNQYAIKAFKYAAADYVLKPVNIGELQQAVEKVITSINHKQVNNRILHLLTNLKTENTAQQKIALPTSEGLLFEDISQMSHLEAVNSYTKIYFKGNRKEMATKNLKDFEDLLPTTTFFRIHHSFIVNINCIKKYHKGRGGYIEMQDGTTIEVAIRKKNAFLELFNAK